MHSMDRYINDIEPRIKAICEHVSRQEEPSLQSALASYGWILLDAWIAWRTMRYLLRDTNIEEKVQEKWVQTPSSYTASQLWVAWNWGTSVKNYISTRTGKKYRILIDDTVQKKRNACAHFNGKSYVEGQDAIEIRKIFDVLSIIFLASELDSFILNVGRYMSGLGYELDCISYVNSNCHINRIQDELESFERASGIALCFRDNSDSKYELVIEKSGCTAGGGDRGIGEFKDVVNEGVEQYSLLENKGFILNIDIFCEAVIKCWGK